MPTLSLDAFRKIDLALADPLTVRGYFPHIYLTLPFEVRDDLPGEDRDLVVLVGKKDRAEALRELAEHRGRVVVMFHPDDGGVGAAHLPNGDGLPPNLVSLFTSNNELSDRRAVSVPLGVRAQNLASLRLVRQDSGGDGERLLYGNFTVSDAYPSDATGRPRIREELVERLAEAPWADLDPADRPRREPGDLLRYYSEIAAHRFVLSPEGHGADCYRTWEALYLGAIPIVMSSPSTSAFSDLPILFTDDYGELSEEYLEESWRKMTSRSFEVERMLASWYLTRLIEAVSSLEDPAFVCWWTGDSLEEIRALLRRARALGAEVASRPVQQ